MSWIILTALWLGVLTSISPCPLAGNIAAISFIARRMASPRAVLLSGVMYTVGRSVAYTCLGVIVLAGLLSSGQAGRFLGKYLNQALGPVLIVSGMLLLGLLKSSASLTLAGDGVQRRVATGGAGWSAILGALLALSFCPISAGLFFGGLLALSARSESRVLAPTMFGVGSALPVVVFAFLTAFGSRYVGKLFNSLSAVEKWVRRVTGAAFILAGVYYCLMYIYGLPLLDW